MKRKRTLADLVPPGAKFKRDLGLLALWFALFVLLGYFFGGVPFVQEHFEVIVLGIVAVSVAPAVIGAVKAALNGRKKKA